MHITDRQTDMCMNHTTWVLRLMILHGFLFNFLSSLTSVRFPSVALISFWVFTKCVEVFFQKNFGWELVSPCSFNLHFVFFWASWKLCEFWGRCVCVYLFIYKSTCQKPYLESLVECIESIGQFFWTWYFYDIEFSALNSVYFFMCLGLLQCLSINLFNLSHKGLEYLLLEVPKFFMHFVAIMNSNKWNLIKFHLYVLDSRVNIIYFFVYCS